MKFQIGGNEEILVKTKNGVTAESLLRVLQLLRDKSPDAGIRDGAALMIQLIAKNMKPSMKALGISLITVNAKWLLELSDLARNKNSVEARFITAFVNEILPNRKMEETVQ
jgi:hypothetical protein